MFSGLGSGRKKSRKVKIREAIKLIIEEEAAKLINEDELRQKAIANVEQNGIVFLDEIDKIRFTIGNQRRGCIACPGVPTRLVTSGRWERRSTRNTA